MQQALPPQSKKLSRFGARARQYLFESIEPNFFTEIQLILLTFCVGIQDAVSFPDFLCFASNQTGNTVIFAVGITGYRSEFFHMRNAIVSLTTFIIGATLAGQIGNVLGARRRLLQVISQIIQVCMVLGAAWIQFAHGTRQSGPWARGAITLLAFSSGTQVATARAFKMTEISTAMATAAWVDLVIDPQILATWNRPRNRRVAFLITLAVGSYAGAYMRRNVGSPIALVVSACGKALVIPMLLMARADRIKSSASSSSGDEKV